MRILHIITIKLMAVLLLAGCTPKPTPADTSGSTSTPAAQTGTRTAPQTASATPTAEQNAADTAPDPDAPKLGSTIKQGETSYKVVGVGKTAFDYTATGESLELLIGDTPGTIVLVPPAGATVHIDPTIPTVTVDGQPHEPLTENNYIKQNGKGVRWTLLELARE